MPEGAVEIGVVDNRSTDRTSAIAEGAGACVISEPARRDAPCVVVGAGPAGLAAAYRLRSRDRAVVVLEAAERVGGRARSIRHAGSTLNTGAAFLASFYDETLALCCDLGVALVEPAIHPSRSHRKRHMVTAQGRLEFGPSDPVAFLRFPAVSLARKLRAAHRAPSRRRPRTAHCRARDTRPARPRPPRHGHGARLARRPATT